MPRVRRAWEAPPGQWHNGSRVAQTALWRTSRVSLATGHTLHSTCPCGSTTPGNGALIRDCRLLPLRASLKTLDVTAHFDYGGRRQRSARKDELMMRQRFRWASGVLVIGLSGALVGVVPGGMSPVAAHARCPATALVTNAGSGTVSTIDVKTRTKNPTDITVGPTPVAVAITPNGKTAFVTHPISGTVSTIDVKTRTKNPTDITVGPMPVAVAVTPNGKTAFVTNFLDSVSTIDVKTRTKNPTDITAGTNPNGVAFTPNGKTASRHQQRQRHGVDD